MINDIVKYSYIPIIIILIVMLVIFFIKLMKLMKKVAYTNQGIEKLNTNIESANNKIQYIESTSNSWSFFISIIVVFSIIKEIIKDYRKTKKSDRNLTKSFTKTCVKNISRINKIKIK